MPVPNSFANVTTSIPLSQLDANFNTPITLGNTAIQLGNTVTTLNNMTLANVTVTSGNVTITNVTVTTANVTTANIGTSIITTSETLNYGTANQVQFLNASKVLTGSANLTFDGTTLTPHTLTVSTGVLTVPAGSNTAPSITTSGDTNTGVFFPAADTVAIGTGGTERLRVDSAGNGGLGVTPAAWASGVKALQVGANSYASTVDLNNGVTVWGSNYYNDGGNKFSNASSRYALQILQDTTNGAQSWRVSNAAGTAGNAITFTQAMTLDAIGNLGVGTTSPADSFTFGRAIDIGSTTGSFYYCRDTDATNGVGGIGYSGTDVYVVNKAVGNIRFFCNTDSSERARITSGGSFLVGKTTTAAVADVGFEASAGGVGFFTSNQDNCIYVNRKGNDGNLVAFYQDTVLEGSISVSGTTVSYNGGHLARWSQLPDNSKDDSILKGTVMSNLDAMCEWEKDGQPLPNEQLNRMKVSDVEGDTNVAGVFVNWDFDEQYQTNDMNIAMTGDMIIRIAQGVTVQKGDLLMSAGDGTAKPQGDDIVRSKTVAKVTSNHVTCTYDDGSYCVPCVLMAC